MVKISVQHHWDITFDKETGLDADALLGLLLAIEESGSIAQAAVKVGLSYRYAWGLLRDAERQFGKSLLDTGRGRGTGLTALAQKLVWADRRIGARLAPTLDSLASELTHELSKTDGVSKENIRLDASHGFAVAALMARINAGCLPVQLRYRHSSDAVAALSTGECDLAGFHVPVGEFEQAALARYRRWLDPRRHCLLQLAVREQGLFVRRDNPLGVRGMADLRRPDLRFVNRQVGSGTRVLLESMLASTGVDTAEVNGFNSAEFTHSAVAAYIASGMADVGLGVRTAAQRFGLDFIPLLNERYFFALPITSVGAPLIAKLMAILQSDAYRSEVGQLAGYDSTATGQFQSIEQAFG